MSDQAAHDLSLALLGVFGMIFAFGAGWWFAQRDEAPARGDSSVEAVARTESTGVS